MIYYAIFDMHLFSIVSIFHSAGSERDRMREREGDSERQRV